MRVTIHASLRRAIAPPLANGYLAAFEQAGADEVICFPASRDPDQVGALAAAVGL